MPVSEISKGTKWNECRFSSLLQTSRPPELESIIDQGPCCLLLSEESWTKGTASESPGMHLLMPSNTKSLTAPQAPQLISAGRCRANRTKGILERRHYAVLHNSGKACRPRVHGLSRLHSHILKGMEREAKATPLPSSRALQHLQGLGPDSPVLHSSDTLVPTDREPAQAQRDSDQRLYLPVPVPKLYELQESVMKRPTVFLLPSGTCLFMLNLWRPLRENPSDQSRCTGRVLRTAA